MPTDVGRQKKKVKHLFSTPKNKLQEMKTIQKRIVTFFSLLPATDECGPFIYIYATTPVLQPGGPTNPMYCKRTPYS